jgi:hypothetical protein
VIFVIQAFAPGAPAGTLVSNVQLAKVAAEAADADKRAAAMPVKMYFSFIRISRFQVYSWQFRFVQTRFRKGAGIFKSNKGCLRNKNSVVISL